MTFRRPARVLAPLTLLACAAAVLLVIQNTLKDDGSASSATTSTTTTTTSTTRTTKASTRKTYRVRSGDTLGGIAERVDVPVDKLLQLNPDVDPQSLRTGQRLKLRE
jgi:LysM repeat protein